LKRLAAHWLKEGAQMTQDLPDEEQGDKFMDEHAEPTPQEEAGTGDAVAGSEIESSGPVEDVRGVAAADGAAETQDSSAPQADLEPAESVPDAADTPPARSTQQDLSGFVEIPGPGRVDEAGWELIQLVYGLKPPFEPDAKVTDAPPLEPPAFVARLQQGNSGPLHISENGRGAAAQVVVELRVSFTPEGLEQLSNDPLRKAAAHSRGETLIVARKVEDLITETRRRESQRRALWDRFRY
jgi:hypothetical protein